jgi:hypothetical protein
MFMIFGVLTSRLPKAGLLEHVGNGNGTFYGNESKSAAARHSGFFGQAHPVIGVQYADAILY